MTSPSHTLHIPVGIRFECTRCANCCLSWPVPLTEGDVKRLTGQLQCSETDLPISLLSSNERQAGLAGFTMALEKRSDGRCSYLDEFSCSLQNTAKPAMCQLFPYSFIDTPDGTFVGLSFASSGVLLNSGRLLQEQIWQLEEMLSLFRELFPLLQNETTEAFSHLKLIEGIGFSYEQFKSIEAPLLRDLEHSIAGNTARDSLTILSGFVQTLSQLVPKEHWRSRLPGTEARPRQIDFYILDALAQAYIDPSEKKQLLDDTTIALSVSQNLMTPPVGFKLRLRGSSYSAVQFLETKLGSLDRASEDLIQRFLYVRLFSKMYFGPGFSNLSLMAGIGHLTALLVLIRLAYKARIIADATYDAANQADNLNWLVELIRQIDSKLTSARYGANTQAMLEILFLDQERLQRLIDLAA